MTSITPRGEETSIPIEAFYVVALCLPGKPMELSRHYIQSGEPEPFKNALIAALTAMFEQFPEPMTLAEHKTSTPSPLANGETPIMTYTRILKDQLAWIEIRFVIIKPDSPAHSANKEKQRIVEMSKWHQVAVSQGIYPVDSISDPEIRKLTEQMLSKR